MERSCVVCHDKPFQFRCIQCHKPVCDDCAFKTEHGAFCGRECAAAYRDFQKSYAGKRKKSSGSLLKVVVVLIILVVAALAAAYLLGQLPGVSGKP
ncbi:MAG: hypothetical protein ACYS8L_07640 [Planctomycetota bacterium]|jgi:hypothetical protein